MDDKTLALGLVSQLISAEIMHSGINTINEDTIKKATDIISLISKVV